MIHIYNNDVKTYKGFIFNVYDNAHLKKAVTDLHSGPIYPLLPYNVTTVPCLSCFPIIPLTAAFLTLRWSFDRIRDEKGDEQSNAVEVLVVCVSVCACSCEQNREGERGETERQCGCVRIWRKEGDSDSVYA